MKKIFLFFIIFFSSSLFSIPNDRIEFISREKFFQKDGFAHTVSSTNPGHWFELESALWFDKYRGDEEIEGLSLNFENLPDFPRDVKKKDRCEQVCLPSLPEGELFNLTSAEFDVITTNYIVESKTFVHPDKYGKIFEQLIREREFLEWLGIIYREYKREGKKFARVQQVIKGRPVLNFCGNSTRHKQVFLSCNWLTFNITPNFCDFDDVYLELWFDLIRKISQKRLIALFKCPISAEFARLLLENGFWFMDNVDYDEVGPVERIFLRGER